MQRKYFHPLTDGLPAHRIGSKATSLTFLSRHGFRIPRTFVCGVDAFAARQEDPVGVQQALSEELGSMLDPTAAYAVRSSANVEDGQTHSFAGQFQSILGLTGILNVISGIEAVWASAHADSVLAYAARAGIPENSLRVAVLVQEMVQPVISGVVFSRNPTTGLEETLIEAVEGSGEALVQQGISPQRWRYKWGEWLEQPDQPVLDPDWIKRLVHLSNRIAAAYGQPVDLEWVYDGQEIYWLQLRPLTGLRDLTVYSNRISREVFPGLVKPLIWSINTPLVNGAWIRLLAELTGPSDLKPHDLARSFYSRAYFNMSALGDIFEKVGMPRQLLEILMGIEEGGDEKPAFRPGLGVLRHLPRMVGFVLRQYRERGALDGKIEGIMARLRPLRDEDLSQLTEEALLARIDLIYELAQELAYHNIVTPLWMFAYTRILRRGLSSYGVDFETYDVTGGLPAFERYSPAPLLDSLRARYWQLSDEERTRVARIGPAGPEPDPEARAFNDALEHFFKQFGHLSESGNDFSVPPWREAPGPVYALLADHEPGPAREKPVHFEDLALSVLGKIRLRGLNARAQSYRLQREKVSFSYTKGYGLFRRCFLELGRRFRERGLLSAAEDIFFLNWDEVEKSAGAAEASAAPGHQDLVEARKNQLESHIDVIPPETIFGEEEPPPQTRLDRVRLLRGVATSRGYYRGPVRVIRGMDDFHKMQNGDVLVIPYSDVGWTPLFTKAGAVIAEAGGILSHSSIVAREYQLPAVVSVDAACSLADDVTVTVDGFKGEIIIHEGGI